MNDETADLLFDVVQRLEQQISVRQAPVVVKMAGTRSFVLTDFDYLSDPDTAVAFERRAARRAREIDASRWVLAVPQVWLITDQRILTRAVSNLPLREGENEAITWMAYDRDDGVDYGRVAYIRRPSGEPVFDDPEILDVALRPEASMPGYTLLTTLTDGDDQTI